MQKTTLFFCLVLFTVACGPTSEQIAATVNSKAVIAAAQTIDAIPTATKQPTYTPAPTLTKQPTLTVIPTQTANPTYTPFPTYTPLPSYTPPPTETAVPTTNASLSNQANQAPNAAASEVTFNSQVVLVTRSQMTSILIALSGVEYKEEERETFESQLPTASEKAGSVKCSEAINYYNQFLFLQVPQPTSDEQLQNLYQQYETAKNDFQALINRAINDCQTALNNGQTIENLGDYTLIEFQSRDMITVINSIINTLRSVGN